MITVTDLTKQYRTITALNHVDFFFANTQIVAIMGENGAGKSTLLKICAGVLPSTSGSVIIDGFSLDTQSLQARACLGYLPEMPEIYERLTGREFLIYVASLRKLNNAEHRILTLADMLGITSFLDYEVGSYSKGMKQKISVIYAIMHEPNNLLLDEPVYGLDPLTSRTIQEFIKKRKGTTIIATHSTQLVEQVADVVYFLMKGEVVGQSHVSSLVKQYGSIEQAYFQLKEKNHV
jgi:ABC-2 type transport system ATP-binding protein